MAVASESAGRRRDALDAQLACVEELVQRRDAVAALAATFTEALREPPSHALVARLHAQALEEAGALDASVERAAAAVDLLSVRLRRTRYRGVYRVGTAWVVPFVDEVGAERRRAFAQRHEARIFAASVRALRAAKPNQQDTLFPGSGGGGPTW